MQDGAAAARQAGDGEAALTIRLPLADFARLISQHGSFMALIMDVTMTVEGDLALAGRLAEMFGAQSAY